MNISHKFSRINNYQFNYSTIPGRPAKHRDRVGIFIACKYAPPAARWTATACRCFENMTASAYSKLKGVLHQRRFARRPNGDGCSNSRRRRRATIPRARLIRELTCLDSRAGSDFALWGVLPINCPSVFSIDYANAPVAAVHAEQQGTSLCGLRGSPDFGSIKNPGAIQNYGRA